MPKNQVVGALLSMLLKKPHCYLNNSVKKITKTLYICNEIINEWLVLQLLTEYNSVL